MQSNDWELFACLLVSHTSCRLRHKARLALDSTCPILVTQMLLVTRERRQRSARAIVRGWARGPILRAVYESKASSDFFRPELRNRSKLAGK